MLLAPHSHSCVPVSPFIISPPSLFFKEPIIIISFDKHNELSEPLSSSMAQKSNNDDLDSEVFGPLVSIPTDSLLRLAKNIRHRVLRTATSTGNIIARIGGSYNLIHIIQLDGFKLGRWNNRDGCTCSRIPSRHSPLHREPHINSGSRSLRLQYHR